MRIVTYNRPIKKFNDTDIEQNDILKKLHRVAFSGNYLDLENTPILDAKIEEIDNKVVTIDTKMVEVETFVASTTDTVQNTLGTLAEEITITEQDVSDVLGMVGGV